MEVVLSPGRFGDEAPGAPFQNEEIREWSHVDRLTGMLERARVETGRWQTSNDQGAARSYGKVIDSRERNSADGSVVQRARRQVEIFQSQGPGRSVQVVRASQWSSSRVTDSSSTKSVTIPDLDRDQKKEKLASLSMLDSRPKTKFREEAISERLSTLLGSFAYPVSSTVPLRRIDSKYAGRTAILTDSKRSNSNEDIASLASRDTNLLHRSQPTEISEENRYSTRAENCERSKMKIAAVNAKREREENIRNKLDISMENEERISGFNCHEAEVPRSTKSAIHLVPPSKANTTVVNLMNDDLGEKKKGEDSAKRPLVSWILPSPATVQETSRTSDLENCHSRRDVKIEDTTNSGITGKSIKRVGFCKTEIHFAADSGKVNIVETDEKPPPTNKFRRRRRLTGITSNKNLPIAEPIARPSKTVGQTNESIEEERSVDHDEAKPRNDPNLHRGHTTTVNLGCDGLTNGNRGIPDGQQYCKRHQESSFPETLQASSQGILLRLENRVYDRLESYSSNLGGLSMNIPRAIATNETDTQASALKSARLVMNLTRNSNVSSVSKILIDDVSRNFQKEEFIIDDVSRNFQKEEFIIDDVSRNFEKEEFLETVADRTKRYQEEPAIIRYLDWQADNEVQSIMLGDQRETSPMKSKNPCEFVTVLASNESTNTHENSESLGIVNEEEMKMEGPLEREKDSSCRQASLTMEKHASKVDYNVVCTDAENNQVLLKVVTTHEPTIARVENDHIRKRLNKSTNFEKASNNEIPKNKQLQLDHTYVNVFTGGQTRVPIYENYKVTESIIKNNKSGKPVKTKEKSSPSEKSSRVLDTKSESSNSLSVTKLVEDTNIEKIKNRTEENGTDGIELIGNNDIVHSSIGNKKIRVKTKDNKLSPVAKKLSGELSSSNSTNSVITSRLRTSKNIKNPTSMTKTNSPRNQDSVSSADKHFKHSNEVLKTRVNKFSTPKLASTRDVASTRSKKSDLTTSKVKPMEVVYQTAVYNMKNEKLSKPQKGKESRGPRYLNELICGAKTKRPSDTKNGKRNCSNFD